MKFFLSVGVTPTEMLSSTNLIFNIRSGDNAAFVQVGGSMNLLPIANIFSL